jgi:serine protease
VASTTSIPTSRIDDDKNPDEEGIRVHWDYEYGEHNDWDTTLEAHGTAVTGIAAATTGNGSGISGISNCRLLTARVSGGADISGGTIDGTNDRIDIANVQNAIEYLEGLGVDIINLSASIPHHVVDDNPEVGERIDEIVDFAEANDILFVTGSGNQGNDIEGVNLPGSREEVLCVGGVSSPPVEEEDWWNEDPKAWDLDLWEVDNGSKSQFGPSVDVVAPADDVLTTWPSGRNHWLLPDDNYGTAVATSMAAPAVTGVAALALSHNPDHSAPELRELIRSSARDLGLPEDEQGAGLVDAAGAVEQA